MIAALCILGGFACALVSVLWALRRAPICPSDEDGEGREPNPGFVRGEIVELPTRWRIKD